MDTDKLELKRDDFGRLRLAAGINTGKAVVPVRSFPISAPGEGIALVDAEGIEQAWIDDMDALPSVTRELIQEELASREFVPEILSIRQVSSYTTPSTWHVETSRGAAELLLKAEEDIRRLSPTTLLIADGHGIQFLIRNVAGMDKTSRRLLDHFL